MNNMDVQLNERQQQIFDNYSSNIINADQLENPTPDLNLPTGQTQDFSSILGTSFQTTPQEQQNIDTLQTQNDDIFSGLLGAMGSTQDRGARTLSAEEQAGIPTLQTDLTDITNQINQTSLDFRRERERIQTEAGLTEGQRNARLRDVSRKQASQLADLEVIRMARSNSLENAQSIVQRKLQLQFADEDARIQNLQFVYGEVKEDLTKAEDRQFQKMMKREEAQLDIAKNEYERLESEKINLVRNAQANGAGNQTMSAILNARSLDEAYRAAGSYGISIDAQLAYQKLKEMRGLNGGRDFPTIAARAEDKVNQIKYLTSDNLSLQFSSGGFRQSWLLPGVANRVNDWRAEIINLTQRLELDELGRIKADGVTFGQLSNEERQAVGRAASSLNTAMIMKNGKPTGRFKMSTERVKENLDTIMQNVKLDFERRTGMDYGTYQSITNPYQLTSDGLIVIPGELSDDDFWSNK